MVYEFLKQLQIIEERIKIKNSNSFIIAIFLKIIFKV